jgi:hypothetical protein
MSSADRDPQPAPSSVPHVAQPHPKAHVRLLGQRTAVHAGTDPHHRWRCLYELLDADLGAELTDQRAHLFRRTALPLHRRW